MLARPSPLARTIAHPGETRDVAAVRLRSRLRRAADVIHRWLGFTLGAVLVILGLTGTLLAFYVEIERQFYPHMQTAHPQARPSSYEAVFQRLAALPLEPAGGTWRIEVPPDGGVITSRYSAPAGSSARVRMVTLDPVSLEVLRDAHWNRTFFTWIYDLHMYLQMGTGAKAAVGVVACVMLLMLLAGVGSWLLPAGAWRDKWRFKRRTTWSRRVYDIHKLSGAGSLLVMTLVVATGAMISMPNQVRPILNAWSPLKMAEPAVSSSPVAGASRRSVDEILSAAQRHFPGSRVVWVRVPSSPSQTYDLQIRQVGAPMTRFPRTHLYIDQFSGQVLAVYDPKRDGWGDTVLNWLVPLHDGKAFGMAGRIVVMLLGLVPALLFATGVMRWQQKRTAAATGAARRL